MRVLSRRVGWDDGLTAPLGQPVAQPPRIIGAIRQKPARGRNARQKLGHAGQIMRLARGEAERNRPPCFVGQGMNLGRPSAA